MYSINHLINVPNLTKNRFNFIFYLIMLVLLENNA